MSTYDLNTGEIFSQEFTFWLLPTDSIWPTYSYKSARELESLIILNFRSKLPNKIKHKPAYDTFIWNNFSSLFDSTIANNSPCEPADFETPLPEEQKNTIKLFSRLCDWTEESIIKREGFSGDLFEWMFAFALRQCDVTKVYDFLEYHLSTNFQCNKSEFLRFLKPLRNKYHEALFNNPLTEPFWIGLICSNLKFYKNHLLQR